MCADFIWKRRLGATLVLAFLMFLAVTVVNASSATINTGDAIVVRLNYGVVIRKIASVEVVTDYWHQAFTLRLPRESERTTELSEVNCSRVVNHSRAACLRIRPVIHYLHNMSARACTKINQVIRYIRAMIPEHGSMSDGRSRSKKGLIDLGGDILHGLFGVARDSDINHVRHVLSEIQSQSRQSVTAWTEVTGHLASFASATNRRFNTLHQTLELQQRDIHTLYDNIMAESVEIASVASILSSALYRLEDFVVVLDDLERLQIGIDALTHGFLSPSLIPPSEISHVMYLVGNMIRRYSAGLRIIRNDPSYYYGLHDFTVARQNDTLVINLPIPLSIVTGPLPLYQVHVFPVPVHNEHHVTVLRNVPNFFTYHPLRNFHFEFDKMPNIKPPNIIDFDTGVLKSTEHFSCILAIMNDRKSEVDRVCNFTLLTDYLRPSVDVIDRSHIIVTNISNATMRCHARPQRRISCESMCQVVLPCRCSLKTDSILVPRRIQDCIQRSQPTVLHSVNLALLQKFFSESQLDDITGNTMFSDPFSVVLPKMKISDVEVSHLMKEDNSIRFDLESLANLTKTDQVAFRSLAHRMVDDWQDYQSRSFEGDFVFWSWKSWLLVVIGSIALFALLLTIRLGLKVRSLTMTLTLLTMSTKSHAVPTGLNFFSSTIPSLDNGYTFDLPTELGWIIIVLILLSIISIFMFLLYRSKRSAYKFDLYMYVGRNKHCCQIWVRSFDLEPNCYSFYATRYIESLSVEGYIMPRLFIGWPTLNITCKVTNETYLLPKSVSISWKQCRCVSEIFRQPYWCVLVTKYNGNFSLLNLPGRDWEEAPAYHLTHGVSMVTLSPTAPGIYPTLMSPSVETRE